MSDPRTGEPQGWHRRRDAWRDYRLHPGYGGLALVFLLLQVISGIFLAQHYSPDLSATINAWPTAFASVDALMHSQALGKEFRTLHVVGASLLFLLVYLHLARALYHRAYRGQERLWLSGIVLLALLMGEAFSGYVLPWGQTSYWGAQVVLNLISTLPLIGYDLAECLRGGAILGAATLRRFHVLHLLLLPGLLLFLVVCHRRARRFLAGSNGDFLISGRNRWFSLELGLVVLVFLAVFFCFPESGRFFFDSNNFLPADPLQTPDNLLPPWYFAPFFAILNGMVWEGFGIPARTWGGWSVALAALCWALLPWLDQSRSSIRGQQSPLARCLTGLFLLDCLALFYLGTRTWSEGRQMLAGLCSLFYFAYFFSMPWWSIRRST